MPSKIFHGLGIGLATAGLALGLWAFDTLDRFEAKTWDWRVTSMAKPSPFTSKIRLIFIDQQSLDWVNKEMALRWPWPREVYRPILEFCRRQGAKAVAFDMLYTEPSSYGVDDDRSFGAAIAQTTGFVNTIFLGRETGQTTTWPTNIPASPIKIQNLQAWLAAGNHNRLVMPQAIFPIPEVATNATLLGNVEARPDPDAIFRRMPLFAVFDQQIVPTLGLAAYLAATTNETLSIEPSTLTINSPANIQRSEIGGQRSEVRDQKLKIENRKSKISRIIPLDRRGKTILHFRGPSATHQRFSAAAVIQSELKLQAGETPPITDPNAFKDCYVLVGCNAPGLLDLRPAPVGRIYTGVEIHATVLDNLLTGDFIRDTPWPATAALTLLLGMLWSMVTLYCRNARDTAVAFMVALPIPAILCVAAYTKGFWLPFLVLEAATAFALVSAVLVNYATEGRQKRFIRGAFKQYLSEDVIEQIVQHPERLQLGGEQRTLSILFSDLQGFTTISEGLNPQELTALLNEYLTAMTDIIQDEGGTVDKYEGDAIIAFWNAPLAQDDHAVRSVRAALRCQSTLAEMRPAVHARIGKDLLMRIGLNTGPVVVGNMGSRNRFNYTILGDAANLASRLEGINKQFGTYTMISETTHAGMGPAFAAREISRVAVVGRKTPVRVFEPMRPEILAAHADDYAQFAKGLSAFYEGQFAKAIAHFEPLREKDPPAAAYWRKCQALQADPPAAWAGVWVMTEK
ncbi:MAG: adenylate/guanylate cyclase domain-containing protein [Verrucomicrobia bacterium]|nr:adenylate/guanylate cyclase domain-containing protein [Verrucomicrobiota bacterium]MBU1736067.1 adenylate/guanylate cyclase domain-containing protein [Verrucomicrobiota bacterium]MBU1857643.1 adenylate/guanylate cyclase domain-containing protein [Verrucomicrobiota bacterium]